MRTRSKNVPTVNVELRYRYDRPNYAPVTYSDGIQTQASGFDIMTDEPRGRGIKPCQHSRETFSSTPGGGSHNNSVTGESYTFVSGNPTQYYQNVTRHHGTAVPQPDPFSLEASISKCKILALDGIDKSDFAFMEDLLELKKTSDLLTNITEPLYDLNKRLERLYYNNRSKSLTIAESLSQAWLVSKYGYGNIIRSTLNALDAYDQRSRNKPVQRTSKSPTLTVTDYSLQYVEKHFHQADESKGSDNYDVLRKRKLTVNALS